MNRGPVSCYYPTLNRIAWVRGRRCAASVDRVVPNTEDLLVMMKVICFCALVGLIGCSGGPSTPVASDVPGDTTVASADPGAADPTASSQQREIGDVVSHLKLSVRLDLRSNLETIKNTEVVTALKDLAMVNIDVSEPVPEELWLAVWVKSGQNFPGSIVLVKGSIFVDYKEVKTFTYVTGAEAARDPFITSFDVLAEFEEVPESILVHASARVSVFEGSDESAFDPETAVVPRGSTSDLESNPARITFVQ